MKKTLTSAMLLAMAATTATAADAELLWSLNVPGSTTDTLVFNYTDAYTGSKNLAKKSDTSYGVDATNHTLTTNGVNQVIRFEGDLGLHMYDSYSLVVKASVSSVGNWSALFALGEDNNWNYKVSTTATVIDGAHGMGIYSEYNNPNGYNDLNSTSVPNKTLTLNEVHTFVLTASNPVGTHQGAPTALSLYVDGNLFASATLQKNNATKAAIKLLTVGARPRDGASCSGVTLYGLDMYKGVVDPKSLVPEPATATLSLLALAGLAARRRRK